VAHKYNAQNKIPLHKTKFHNTKLNSTTVTTQNQIPPVHKTQFTIHKTQFHCTKLNFTTQNSISLHKTQFHCTKLNSTTQNSIPPNSIPLHKTQFTIHLQVTTSFSGKVAWPPRNQFFLLRHLTAVTTQRKEAVENRF
jgi:hypothetical protein